MTDLAFTASDKYVSADRWIATLSDGTTVFQNRIPGRKSAWIRLKAYVIERRLQITSLRLQAFGHTITLPSTDKGAEGYWHSNRARAILGKPEVSEELSVGVGYITEDQVHVTWINPNGDIKQEIRGNVPSNKTTIFPVY